MCHRSRPAATGVRAASWTAYSPASSTSTIPTAWGRGSANVALPARTTVVVGFAVPQIAVEIDALAVLAS